MGVRKHNRVTLVRSLLITLSESSMPRALPVPARQGAERLFVVYASLIPAPSSEPPSRRTDDLVTAIVCDTRVDLILRR